MPRRALSPFAVLLTVIGLGLAATPAAHASTASVTGGVLTVANNVVGSEDNDFVITCTGGGTGATCTPLDTGGSLILQAGCSILTMTCTGVNSIVVNGGLGTDTIQVDSGLTAANQLNGGDGDDTFVQSATPDNDTISGDAGTDTVTYALRATAGQQVSVTTGDSLANDGSPSELDNLSLENVIGTPFDDTIREGSNADGSGATSDNNVFTGGLGDDTLRGGNGDDTLRGGAGTDPLRGGAGTDTVSYADRSVGITASLAAATGGETATSEADTFIELENLVGSAQADVLTGSDAVNTIDGSGGNDTVNGGLANDTLIGGANTDTLSYADRTEPLTIIVNGTSGTTAPAESDTTSLFENAIGGSGDDSITGDALVNTLEGRDGDDTLVGGALNDVLLGGEAGEDNGGDTVSYADKGATAVVATLGGTGGTAGESDTLTELENLTGAGGADTLSGDAAGNTIKGGAGNDVLGGGASGGAADGNDALDGEADTDTITYATRSTGVTANLATNTGGQSLTLEADTYANAENLTGGSAADVLTGSSLANVLTGNGGDDTLDGGSSLVGETFDAGNDTLTGNDGTDTTTYPNRSVGITGVLGAPGTAGQTASAEADTLNSMEVISGSPQTDTFTGSTNDGDDVYRGQGGADSLAGAAGNDTLDGGADNDTVDGGAGDDAINGGAGTDTLRGDTTGDLTVIGTDTIHGDADADSIDAGPGADQVFGDAGDDTIAAGESLIDGSDGNDAFDGGADTDTVSYASRSTAVTASLGGGTATGSGGQTGQPEADTFTAVENLTGSQGNDTLTGNPSANTLQGAGGNDTLDGGNLAGGADASDVLQGDGGTNTASYASRTTSVTADLGLDTAGQPSTSESDTIADDITNVTGGSGADVLTGADAESNTLTGGGGDDALDGGTGNDALVGGAGDHDLVTYAARATAVAASLDGTGGETGIGESDTLDISVEDLTGTGSDDTLNGSSIANRITGGSGADTIDGVAGDDEIHGGNGNDAALDGGSGLDSIYGEAGDDTINGGPANDLLDGGAGTNVLTGAGGTDRVDYAGRAAGASVVVDLSTTPGTATVSDLTATDSLTTVEDVFGTPNDDTLTGSTAANALDGRGGNDTLQGRLGDDVLTGAGGTDRISYADRTALADGVTVDLDAGTGGLTAGGEADTIATVENLTGGAGNDTLKGSTVANDVVAGDGDDAVDVSDAVTDTVDCGAGTDAATSDERDVLTACETPPTQPGLATLSVDDPSLAEGDSGATDLTYTVTLSKTVLYAVTVDYAITPGTAATPSDYVANDPLSGTLTFAPGDTTKTVRVSVKGDTLVEPGETLTFTLSNPADATLADATGTGTITNDDTLPTVSIDDVARAENASPATFTVTASKTYPADITGTVNTIAGTATAGADYTAITDGTFTITAGQTTATVTVPVLDDTADEGTTPETYSVKLTAASNATYSDDTGAGTITDDDPTLSIGDASVIEGDSGTKTLSLPLALNRAATRAITGTVNTTDVSATAGSDYVAISGGSFSIAIGETTGSVSVTVNADTALEGSEAFDVVLSAVNASVSDATGRGTITDDDTAATPVPVTPVISVASVTVPEGNAGSAPATFTVKLSQATTQTVKVSYRTVDNTATAGTDYTAASAQLTFAAGETSKSVPVPVSGDTVAEADESFGFVLFGAENGTLSNPPIAVATITNDDKATAARVRPKLSLTIKPARDRRAPYAFALSGRLTPPTGMTAKTACASGRVVITIKRANKKSVKAYTATLKPNCTYKVTAKLPASTKPGALKAAARFGGNPVLLPAKTAAKSLRAG